jgi:hypothetical protein
VVADNKVPGMTEWFLGNIFRGIKYNPVLFVKLWNDTGLTKLFIEFISERLKLKSDASKISENLFDLDKHYGYEESLSMFISAVAKETDLNNSKETFYKIVELFRLKLPSIHGDFVVDSAKINYQG